jgi:general secretion pathway protein G
MKLRNKKGFTLIEVIVVAGIIAVLAGILVPLIFKEIDESKISRAAADIRSISSAMIILKKDTGQWPVNASCSAADTMIMGDGTIPVGPIWDATDNERFDNFLLSDVNACFGTKWKGPYIASVSADPWGYAYVSNAKDYSGIGPIWIMSAGPNGVLETASNATVIDTANSDDIGLRLR